MSKPSTQNLQQFISRFSPLSQIPDKYHSQLASHVRVITIATGEKFIRKPKQSTVSHFLLKGRVEVRESFDNRFPLSHNDQRKVALEEQVGANGTIKALTPCILMVINNEVINQYLLWNEDYSVYHLDDGELPVMDDVLIDDDFQDDWENVFIRSPLAANLSNMAIHQLMSQLEDVVVKADECVFKARSPGDYFYVIKKGFAQVHTEKNGPFKGKVIQLTAGNYFGDEALIADTPRNASVIMESEGLLGRLDIDAFNSIVKKQLIPAFEMPADKNQSDIRIIDVRFPIEFKQNHDADSTNIPISLLRKKLSSLESSYLYIMAPADDKRSELATYLMRQAGFNAYQAVSQPQPNDEEEIDLAKAKAS